MAIWRYYGFKKEQQFVVESYLQRHTSNKKGHHRGTKKIGRIKEFTRK